MYNIGEENEQIEFKKSTGELKEGVIAIASILTLKSCNSYSKQLIGQINYC